MAHEFTTSYLKDSTDVLRLYKRLAERAMAQAPDEGLFASPDAESNSIAIIVKHLAGNMRSRWTDFLETDGEKPSRDRDGEFESPPATRAELMDDWESGWKCVFDTLAGLKEEDLGRTVHIRGEAHSVMQAIQRMVAHTSYHLGQVIYLAKQYAGQNWTAVTIPRGKSREFNSRVTSGKASQR
jgi:hypothetical protein